MQIEIALGVHVRSCTYLPTYSYNISSASVRRFPKCFNLFPRTVGAQIIKNPVAVVPLLNIPGEATICAAVAVCCTMYYHILGMYDSTCEKFVLNHLRDVMMLTERVLLNFFSFIGGHQKLQLMFFRWIQNLQKVKLSNLNWEPILAVLPGHEPNESPHFFPQI